MYSIMRWGKVVLIFQAVVTLIIGMVFFWQVLSSIGIQISQLSINMPTTTNSPMNIQQTYSAASYILVLVSLIELIIISRLFT